MDKRDKERLIHICGHCSDAKSFIERFGDDYETFTHDKAFFNSVAMCVMQVGELANGLTEEFRKETGNEVPWHLIRGMRNMVAHSYNDLDVEIIWETANKDLPKLQDFCERYLAQEKQIEHAARRKNEPER